MIKNKILFVVLAVFAGSIFVVQVRADDSIGQPDFSSSESQSWGSFAAAIGIASGTISEFGTTTAALGDFMRAYLGWECDMRVENYGAPWWCNSYIPLTLSTTTILGTSTRAFVFQNPHQAVDGNAELFYVDFYGGNPAYMGFGTPANTTPNLSWSWTCGPYCRNGGTLGGTSNGFVPYLEMGPQADPPTISSLAQSVPGGSVIPESGTIFGRSISLGATLASTANDPLILQVEVEPTGTSFTGMPTASSTAAAPTGTASVSLLNLADGGYRWAARAVDANTSESSPWLPFTPGGAIADFTVQAPKKPVIFIPGIVGSRLTRASDGKEIWPNIGEMLMSPSDNYLDDLALTPDGAPVPGKEMAASSIIDHESVLGISASFYDNILRALENDGYHPGTTLFAFPYDWRLGVKNAAASLANTIAAARAASQDGKISIIGYSMGGLVAKEYLAGLQDVSFVDKLILAGAPQLGSPEAFKVLNYGDNLGFQIPVVNLDILNHTEVKKIAQNMPSIYDLLPSQTYLQDTGGYVQDFRNGGSSVFDYNATNELMLANPSDSRNSQLLTAADALHMNIDTAAANAPDVYNIVGCSRPTISGYRLYDKGVVDVSRDDGDGTVPLTSAMDRADGFQNYFISGSKTGITHTNLVNDSRMLALLMAILDGKMSSFTLPDGFSKSLGSCLGGGSMEFSAHGAAGLTVQNGAGLSVGLNASGTIDLGIPDSTYDVIGDNYFITVPAGNPYQLMVEASSSDDLVVKAREYNGGSAGGGVTYVVSSTAQGGEGTHTGTTTAELDFSGIKAGGNLIVTKSGNASSSDDAQTTSTTFSIAPVVESSSSDITPPQISVSGISPSVAQGSTTTISFMATDTDSGMAVLYATFNGTPIANGDTITFAQTGDNVLRVEAIDNAGNPVVEEMDITVSAASAPNPVEDSASSSTEETASSSGEGQHELSFSLAGDTYIDAANPDTNYGNDAILRLRARGKNRTLVKFDGAAIKNAVGSSTILSAKLAFSVAKNWKNFSVGGGSLALHRMLLPWTENSATWNTENSIGSALWGAEPTATTTVSNDTTSTVLFDVTADIQALLEGTENDEWILKKADECAPGVIDFGSRESETAPVLTVTYSSSE